MEITKNLIVYKHNKFNRISNFNFGTQYKDNTGKLHQLKDVNGLDTTFQERKKSLKDLSQEELLNKLRIS